MQDSLPPDLQRTLLTITLPWLGDGRGDIKLLLGPDTRDGIAWGDGVSARKLGEQLLDHATLSEWQAIVNEIRRLDDSADRLALIKTAISRLNTLKAEAAPMASTKPHFDTVKLCEILSRADFVDLRLICADLNARYEDIVGEGNTVSVAALAIVEHFSRRDALTALVQRVREAFPAAEWMDVASSEDLPSIALSESGRMTSQAHIGGADPSATRSPGPLRVFLCHSKLDKTVARSLHTWLLTQGAQPWLDEVELLPGQDWRENIRDAVQRSDVVLVCISKQSVNRDGFIRDEIAYALNQAERLPRNAVYLVPLRIDDCDVPKRLARWQWLDWFVVNWEERLQRTLQHRADSLSLMLSVTPPISTSPQQIVMQADVKQVAPDRQSLHTLEPFEMQLVHVPAGEFLMGSDPKKDKDAKNDEQPQHTVYLDSFDISKYPVTNSQWMVFSKVANIKFDHVLGKENHPAVNLTWNDAKWFCEWLSRASGRFFRLPTEAEWEKAARGSDGRTYPWGDLPPSRNHCNINNWFEGTTAVGQFSPLGDSPYGASDMAGNVHEWCLDLHVHSIYQRRTGLMISNPFIDDDTYNWHKTDHRVLRGTSWNDYWPHARAAYRSSYHPNSRLYDFGLRVVSAPAPVPSTI